MESSYCLKNFFRADTVIGQTFAAASQDLSFLASHAFTQSVAKKDDL